ncbi:MAG: GFA family protein, partial [Patescibacteria group bacterium]
MKTYTGGCHCGKVRYEVEADFKDGMSCNCSYCGKMGWLLSFVPEKMFKLISGGDNQSEYRFNTKNIQHLFCKDCGVHCFGKGKGPDGAGTCAVNLRTIDNLDTESLS